MLVPALLALSLVSGQAGDPYDDDYGIHDDEQGPSSPFVMTWGGNAWESGGGVSAGVLGGEAGWSWEAVDLSVAGYGYRDLHRKGQFAPVILGRIGQRLRSYRGLEGTLVLGIGAARTTGWATWFQFGLGVRIPLGPLLLGGEITWEQNNLIRLVGGLGARF
jgi:hypothetical protein